MHLGKALGDDFSSWRIQTGNKFIESNLEQFKLIVEAWKMRSSSEQCFAPLSLSCESEDEGATKENFLKLPYLPEPTVNTKLTVKNQGLGLARATIYSRSL